MPILLVLVASLLGSTHCAAMCGGFVALCSQGPSPVRSQAAYHVGRLITYLVLGLIAGIAGSAVNRVGESFGITEIATILTASLLIVVGVSGLLQLRISSFKGKIFQIAQAFQQRVLPDRSRVFLYPLCIGLFSTFLPCGWLYTYVAVAAGQPSILHSSAVMLLFWIGTLPILITVGSLSNVFVSPLTKYVPYIASILMITAGALSLYSHISAPSGAKHNHCAHH